MKKILVIFLVLLSTLTLFSCKEDLGLTPYVSELRSNLYQGTGEDFTVKGGYGFKETPYQNDGKVASPVYQLNLKLIGKETSQVSHVASLDFNGQKYTATFKLSPVSHCLVATFEIENFNLNEFNLNISCGDKTQTVTMKTILPQGTISYEKALSCLEQSKPQLIKAFCDEDGNFNAEIYARIIVKKDKAYWYIGFAGGNDLLKALLIDGATGEVLAIREII